MGEGVTLDGNIEKWSDSEVKDDRLAVELCCGARKERSQELFQYFWPKQQ